MDKNNSNMIKFNKELCSLVVRPGFYALYNKSGYIIQDVAGYKRVITGDNIWD